MVKINQNLQALKNATIDANTESDLYIKKTESNLYAVDKNAQTRANVNDIAKDFFREINKNNKADYLSQDALDSAKALKKLLKKSIKRHDAKRDSDQSSFLNRQKTKIARAFGELIGYKYMDKKAAQEDIKKLRTYIRDAKQQIEEKRKSDEWKSKNPILHGFNQLGNKVFQKGSNLVSSAKEGISSVTNYVYNQVEDLLYNILPDDTEFSTMSEQELTKLGKRINQTIRKGKFQGSEALIELSNALQGKQGFKQDINKLYRNAKYELREMLYTAKDNFK